MMPKRANAVMNGIAILAGLGIHAQAVAQSSLMALDVPGLRAELDTRFNAAVAASRDASVLRSEDSRFLWASEAKAQCGIAIGFTKARKKDPESVSRCDAAHARMMTTVEPLLPVPAAPASTAEVTDGCPDSSTVEVFFEWNEDVVVPDAATTLRQLVSSRTNCSWGRFAITGHTDTSGDNRYNDRLSMRRALNVASGLEALGIARSGMIVSGTGEAGLKVETADGVREPANRRVEIVAQSRAK